MYGRCFLYYLGFKTQHFPRKFLVFLLISGVSSNPDLLDFAGDLPHMCDNRSHDVALFSGLSK